MKTLSQHIKDNESSLISLNEKLVVNKDYNIISSEPIDIIIDSITNGEKFGTYREKTLCTGYNIFHKQKTNYQHISKIFKQIEESINNLYEKCNSNNIEKILLNDKKTLMAYKKEDDYNDYKILIYKNVKNYILILAFYPLLGNKGFSVNVNCYRMAAITLSHLNNLENKRIMPDEDFIYLFETIYNNDKYKTKENIEKCDELLYSLKN